MGYDGSRQHVTRQACATLAVIVLFVGGCVILGTVGGLIVAGVRALG